MKALLVVDVPLGDKTIFNECDIVADVKVRARAFENIIDMPHEVKTYPLKPLPEKKNVDVKSIDDVIRYKTIYSLANKISSTIILETDKCFSMGFNACIDEILGE